MLLFLISKPKFMILIHSCGPRLFNISSGALFKNRLAGIALGILFLLILTVTPASAEIHRLNSDEMTLFQRISSNAGQQRETVALDPILCIVARQRAADMARRNYFSHTNRSGQGANFLVRRAGFVLPNHYSSTLAGNNIESIGMSTGSAKEIFSQWLKSSAHRLHVLGELDFYREQTSVGVGVFRSPRAPYYKYFVFLSAPPNAALRPRAAILKNPKGATIASNPPLADAWARITGTATR